MTLRVYAAFDIAPRFIELLGREFLVQKGWQEPVPHPETAAVFTTGTRGCRADEIAAMPALRLIHCFGSGYDQVDLPAAAARGVTVTNCPAVNHRDVADYTMGLIIALVRGIGAGERLVRSGRWQAGAKPLSSIGVWGRKLGILGLGAIGRELARRAAGFDMVIGYHNPRPKADAPYEYLPSLAALAGWCDVLAVCARAGPDNVGLIDAAVFEALGRDGFFVNIARGSIVNEGDLAAALAGGVIAGAALDVYVREPGGIPALAGMDNVVLSPHQAGHVGRVFDAQGEVALANFRALAAGGALQNRVL